MNKKLVKFLDSTFYAKTEDRWDDKIFRKEILDAIKPSYIVLDVGAGRGRILEMNFKGLCEKIYGIDPDEGIFENPIIDKGYLGLADSMPFFEDNYFDLIFCDNVLEHVENPTPFYNEIYRVLKDKGVFLSKTPNKYHYMPTIARCTPTSFHKFYNKMRGRAYDDTFPTFYRANTKKAYKKFAKASKLKLTSTKCFSGRPEYLRIFFITYIFGIIYERTVNFLKLNSLKAIVISKMEK
ncbi:ubiquinone/menaquinone biosynthesis C-methylase UbiE [Aquimarina sp. EL_43]|uniref:class I SAM-dependent methyltransferase n=1 Tax=unclassified Aquimarina TaxID=2627091 RepID=UPI0018CBCAAA|nr:MULTISPECIES: class I SAM-dependent methyltransferase [unclassified Aquimarina]MBG6131697.1 ubiquinone/menaquinone biosynthesis C-methylase UbiE [Aquimarina sp. EL_35]MBG6152158.1 ubiquinone/menaquinone biosynthesis C-methylase UbiE [Aquimarina sp. EL_32]MBG6169898.1 ubiquinone/menaquinone biosynthesis C-methylase UbiE [Aquimarina sp. EL_43]